MLFIALGKNGILNEDTLSLGKKRICIVQCLEEQSVNQRYKDSEHYLFDARHLVDQSA